MKLRVLGSSSAGNTYLIESDTECLVLEAGLPFKDAKKALDFNVSKIVGVIVSHGHFDHFGHAKEYLKSGIPVYASEETHKSLSKEYSSQKIVRPGYWYQIGGFNITPFRCQHDVECYGYIIRHDKIGTLLFGTDSEFIKYNFKSLNLNHIMIECNYSQKIIDARVIGGDTVQSLRDRVIQSHMELETCKRFIQANKTSNLYNVCLLHLSDGNSNEIEFIDEVQKVVGAGTEVFVANKGLEVPLDLCPF